MHTHEEARRRASFSTDASKPAALRRSSTRVVPTMTDLRGHGLRTTVRPRSQATATLLAKMINGKQLSAFQKGFLMLEEPTSSVGAQTLSGVLRLSLVVSAAVEGLDIN